MSKQDRKEIYDLALTRVSAGSQRNRGRLRLILSRKPGGRLLEIGCGRGALLEQAMKHFEIEGVERSPHAIDLLRDTFGDRVREANIEEEALDAETYDVVAVFNVLEHLKNPGKVIREINRALKLEGVMVGSVPNNSGILGTIHTALTNIFDRTHCSTYPPIQWKALFQDVGFREVEMFGEVMLGPNISTYIRNRIWNQLSFNMVFICRK
ncbi:MAG: class I SAM-dependent methyltransferase [Anaerolineales bacterium]|jgi:2-polyprenyl-3-methyl-5-hydroxy-6-metoxy-1,4-benzoquinol methylase